MQLFALVENRVGVVIFEVTTRSDRSSCWVGDFESAVRVHEGRIERGEKVLVLARMLVGVYYDKFGLEFAFSVTDGSKRIPKIQIPYDFKQPSRPKNMVF